MSEPIKCCKCNKETRDFGRGWVSTGHDVCNNCRDVNGSMAHPLLVIVVKDMNSIPVVRYKGEDITGRIHVDYTWNTSSLLDKQHELNLEYVDKNDESGKAVIKKIGEKLLG